MPDALASIEIGMTGEAEVVVTPEITVGGHVPGMPMVYGTPFMILLMEIASGRAIETHLPEGFVSVGSHVDVRHLAPTPLGRRVVATRAGDREDPLERAVRGQGARRRAVDRRGPAPARRGGWARVRGRAMIDAREMRFINDSDH